MSVGLMAARWPSSFFLKKKNQKFKAAQPGAKSPENGHLQFEAVGKPVKDFIGSAPLRQIAFWCG